MKEKRAVVAVSKRGEQKSDRNKSENNQNKIRQATKRKHNQNKMKKQSKKGQPTHKTTSCTNQEKDRGQEGSE